MNIKFTAYDTNERIRMDMEGMTRFTSLTHIIKQAARNGQRRLGAQ